MEKIDPHNSKHYLELWKQRNTGLSKPNEKILKQYISEMETGINTNGSTKGGRSAIKLLAMARQMQRLMSLLENKYKLNQITQVTEKTLHDLFSKMQQGKITRIDGKPYRAVNDFVVRFKAFWHWHMKKTKKEEGKAITDITSDLESSKKKKPEFVYFTKEELDKLLELADYDTRVFMLFLFDTGIRTPTEAMNIRVCDFSRDFKDLSIREETSKTFGRNIKLMLCSEAIKKFIQDNSLSGNDLLFTIQPATMNKRLKDLGKRFGKDKTTIGRKPWKDLTMYDFRHSSACFWLPRYKSRNALLYRFGWKKEEEIHYYTELLGMKDTIAEEDLLLGFDKTILEKTLDLLKKENKDMKKDMAEIKKCMAEIKLNFPKGRR